MDYEKKYKEALQKIRELIQKGRENGWTIITYEKEFEEIFPELKESEDERIRKGLIKAVSRTFEGNKLFGTDVTMEEALAWLERQGEQKVSYTTTVETGDGGINALVTRDIEIPFGAKDSELQEATYYIPQGYYAKIESDKVVIKKGEQKPAWSEEDKDVINHLLAICNGAKKFIQFESCSREDIIKCQDWLTSLKQKIE